ncbi:MAG: hypothetical protein HY875_15335 [Chloroflexi bacterium]|nr:hypothetical protein [Chloroflexota bacterium]
MMMKCTRCGIAYSHTRSTSALVLTYCGMLCEVSDLGYSMAAFEKAPIVELRRAIRRRQEREEVIGLAARMAA